MEGNGAQPVDVEQLANGRIKFYLLALWVSHYNPDNIHNGELQATAILKGNTAIYEDENCQITMKFHRNSVTVTQSEAGDCDFGANVTASGTYSKINSKKPKFDF